MNEHADRDGSEPTLADLVQPPHTRGLDLTTLAFIIEHLDRGPCDDGCADVVREMFHDIRSTPTPHASGAGPAQPVQTATDAVVGATGHIWPCPRFYVNETMRPCNCTVPDAVVAADVRPPRAVDDARKRLSELAGERVSELDHRACLAEDLGELWKGRAEAAEAKVAAGLALADEWERDAASLLTDGAIDYANCTVMDARALRAALSGGGDHPGEPVPCGDCEESGRNCINHQSVTDSSAPDVSGTDEGVPRALHRGRGGVAVTGYILDERCAHCGDHIRLIRYADQIAEAVRAGHGVIEGCPGAAAVLAVVEAHTRQAQAQALRDAAEEIRAKWRAYGPPPSPASRIAHWLRARADELDPKEGP